MEKLEKDSACNTKVLNVAFNYGGREEIVQAARRVQDQGKELTEESLGSALYTDGCPDPDLIVRTGGEMRISNFLLWQAAYAELYFTDTLWPDMREKDVDMAVEAFRKRNRRYGGV
jgi:undecaprenyl diphosphate synthase